MKLCLKQAMWRVAWKEAHHYKKNEVLTLL